MQTGLLCSYSDENVLRLRGYKIKKQLGEGAFSKVFLCERYSARKRQMACKIIDSKKYNQQLAKTFLFREMEILVKVKHNHIIHTETIFQRRSKYYLFMRYAELGDLLDYIVEKGRTSESLAKMWTFQLALAVQYLHSLDIVHRDIKCENILITKAMNVKLCDFTFTRRMNLTFYLSTTYCGSIKYSAPEILSGTPYDPKKSDVWSIGIVLYVMLNACFPFTGNDFEEIVNKQMAKSYANLPEVEKAISLHAKGALEMLLEPKASLRGRCETFLNIPWIAMEQSEYCNVGAKHVRLRSCLQK